eukprot:symbB.v1.2.010557.t1/scaffold694.1/size172116/20
MRAIRVMRFMRTTTLARCVLVMLAMSAGTAFSSLREHLVRRAVPENFEDTPEYKEFARRHIVDEDQLFRESSFPIPPKKLVRLAKMFLATEAPEKVLPSDGQLLADDFRFVGPYIGPLDTQGFYHQRDNFDFFQSFPDASAQFHDFRVDPFAPNRVWWTVRGNGTHTGEALPGSDAELVFGAPTGIQFENPPQACSVTFNEKGQVTEFTVGYVMDRMVGNTGGMGGFFGVLWRIGKGFPISEAQPYKPSWSYWLFVEVGKLFSELRIMLAKAPAKMPWESWETSTPSAGREGEAALAGFRD